MRKTLKFIDICVSIHYKRFSRNTETDFLYKIIAQQMKYVQICIY